MQIAMAVASIANEGLLMKPYVVERVVDDQREIQVKPIVVRRAVSQGTAETLTKMLVASLEQSDSAARIPGYRVAGKTGTAEIPVPGGYHPTLTLASFVGYLPADDPQVLVLVIIDRPTTSRWGTQTAAPTFERIAEQLVILLDIPPDNALARNNG
jgi:cell division protein FtsI/penicillin-binding protein 2